MNTAIINKIYAKYNEETVRVYQAYNDDIANQAIAMQTFGDKFSMSRMTWIKPSFLWMMYRSGWATKDGQTRILGIDIKREGFETILNQAVLSAYSPQNHVSKEAWKKQLKSAAVRCQWDPERDIYGNPMQQRAIQLGIKGEILNRYVNEWIYKIEDITPSVVELRTMIKNDTFKKDLLPKEQEYIFL